MGFPSQQPPACPHYARPTPHFATPAGMMFNSRGFKDASASKGAELEAALLEASEGGKLPIVVDTSPCLSQVGVGGVGKGGAGRAPDCLKELREPDCLEES
eukprot:352441-Chlamydomonas_euryale.AAC.2